MSDPPERFDRASLVGLPEAAAALGRLPPGRHGLPRDFVARNQRLRLVAAMLRALREHGYPATTIAHITAEAGVSRAAFYGQFTSKEDCFRATYDLASGWFCERVERVVAGASSWPERTRAGVGEAAALLSANPLVANLFAVEAPQAGAAARARQRACLVRFAQVLRPEGPPRPEPTEELEELLLGGAISLIARYVEGGRPEQIQDALATLLESLIAPCLDR